MAVPGTLAPNRSVTPSSGCTRMTSAFLPSSSVAVDSNGQVRRALEDDGDLGDAAAEALAGAQVERHPGPAAVVDVDADRGERLGGGLRVEALLLEVADDLLAALPPGRVLAAGGVLADVAGQRGPPTGP